MENWKHFAAFYCDIPSNSCPKEVIFLPKNIIFPALLSYRSKHNCHKNSAIPWKLFYLWRIAECLSTKKSARFYYDAIMRNVWKILGKLLYVILTLKSPAFYSTNRNILGNCGHMKIPFQFTFPTGVAWPSNKKVEKVEVSKELGIFSLFPLNNFLVLRYANENFPRWILLSNNKSVSEKNWNLFGGLGQLQSKGDDYDQNWNLPAGHAIRRSK